MSKHDPVRELLASYAAGTASADERRHLEEHLWRCATCRAELEQWRVVRAGVRIAETTAVAPPASIVSVVLDRAGAGTVTEATDSHAGMAWQLLRAQLPLVQARLWWASALVMAVGFAVAAAGTNHSAGVVVSLVAPAVAAAGVAALYGPEVDPSLELALSTPTSPRSVLLARLTLVFGYDLLLALAGSVLLTGFGAADGLWLLIAQWLGPMALLSALSLAISVWIGPSVAITTVLALWGLRVASGSVLQGSLAEFVRDRWSTDPVVLGLAAALVAAVVLTTNEHARLLRT